MAENTVHIGALGFQETLKRKELELTHGLRRRDGIAVETSADQMDQIQYAAERDMAIRNVDRDSALLRDVRAALGRIDEGGFGTCLECDSAISPKRLLALPWAPYCMQCQQSRDRGRREDPDSVDTT